MSIHIAPDKGSIDKAVTEIYIMPAKAGPWKQVTEGYIAPSKGALSKLFYELVSTPPPSSWVLKSGTILYAVNSGSGSYYSTVYAYASQLSYNIKPKKVYLYASFSSSSAPPETLLSIYVVAEYYNGSSWVSMGGFSHYAEGSGTHSKYVYLTLPGTYEVNRTRYRVTNTTSGVTMSMSVNGKVTEWYAEES